MEEKRAIVLAGGGSRGSYQIGVWKALKELDYDFQIVTGTSVGSLNGAVMVTGDIDNAIKMWESITTDMILDCKIDGDISTPEGQSAVTRTFFEQVIKKRSIDQTPLKNLLINALDIEKFFESEIDFGVVTMSYPKLKPQILFKDQIEKDKLIDYLMASSACFPAMKAYKIDGELFIDGGFYDNMPINSAIERGATEVIAIDLATFGITHKIKDKNVKVTVISPKSDLGFSLLFDGEFAKRNIKLGYNDALKAFKKADGFKYTFEKDSFLDLNESYLKFENDLDERFKSSTINTPDFVKQRFITKLYKTVVKASDKYTAAKMPVIVMAEFACEYFKIEPFDIFKPCDINRKIKLEMMNTEREVKLKNIVLSERLRFSAIDTEIIYLIFSELAQIMNGKDITPVTCLVAALFPQQFLAAIYIYLIS